MCGSCREGQGARGMFLIRHRERLSQICWSWSSQASPGDPVTEVRMLFCKLRARLWQSCQTRQGAGLAGCTAPGTPTHSGQVAERARAVFPCQTRPGRAPPQCHPPEQPLLYSVPWVDLRMHCHHITLSVGAGLGSAAWSDGPSRPEGRQLWSESLSSQSLECGEGTSRTEAPA